MNDEAPVRIPHQELSPEALRGVVEAFVLREGTDYGPAEFSLAEKCRQVVEQLASGEAEIWFDPDSRSVTIQPVGSPAQAASRPRPEGQ